MLTFFRTKNGFTLLEVLIVIAIIAILALVLILALSPGELLSQGRDANRLTELESVANAIRLAETYNIPNLSIGTPMIVYTSLPDSSPTCDSHTDLPRPLPIGWTYHCSSENNYRKIDGTGWIPIDFTILPKPPPFAVLPIDETNTSESGYYYTYATDSRDFEIEARMQSEKYQGGGNRDVESKDGGNSDFLFESGTKQTILPMWEIKMDVAGCRDSTIPLSSNRESYTRWKIPGTGKARITKLWFYNEGDFSSNEILEIGAYNGTEPNYTKGNSTNINGGSQSGWMEAKLNSIAVDFTLGQNIAIGVGSAAGGMSTSYDDNADAYCPSIEPFEDSHGQLYNTGLDQNFTFPDPTNTNFRIINFGVTFVR